MSINSPGSANLAIDEDAQTMSYSSDSHLSTGSPHAVAERLAPIRFFIDKSMTNKYQQVGALANEISNCFPKADLDIKFAYMRDHKVFIVTDDIKTHDLLSNMDNWPKKAFEKGLSAPTSNVTKTFKIKLLGLPTSQDIPSLEEMLVKEGISKAKRITTRSGHTTSLVEATVTGKSNYDRLIKEGFKLGLWSKIYKVAPRNSMLQCYKCLQTGHLKARCPADKPLCINCGQNDCSALTSDTTCSNAPHCINCNGTHSGVSRKCPVLKEVENKQKETQHKAPQGPATHSNAWRWGDPRHPLSSGGTRPAVSSPPDELNDMKNEIINTMIEKINMIIESKIESMLNTLLDKLVIKLANLPQFNHTTHASGSNSPSPLKQTQPDSKKRKVNTLNSISNALNSMPTEKTRSKSSGQLPHNSTTTTNTKKSDK